MSAPKATHAPGGLPGVSRCGFVDVAPRIVWDINDVTCRSCRRSIWWWAMMAAGLAS